MTERDVLGLVPARGGSKGVPEKNIRDIAGKPLIAHSIESGRKSTVIDSVVVSTDDEEIATVAEEYHARVPFLRPDNLATDTAPTSPVVEDALETLAEQGESYDDIVLLQPTSPLRSSTHIDEAYELYTVQDADSLISAYPTTETRWRSTSNGAVQLNYEDESKRRQDREPEYIINGAVYVTAVEAFLSSQELITGETVIYEMDEIDSIDVDTPFDLWLAEQVMTEWKQ
ncbi:cytidylyltransferase domain-containing protein [Halovivax cerinus]|uniref:Cytidylyltransferase domain-containing protein n=1 Tax=Halovivax cerinus TaxID=1487865 RepID=A0ABD5NQT0_9EURY|nr:acylneuraminate cytidylyltransferase family protein [Halovivax cerinus]